MDRRHTYAVQREATQRLRWRSAVVLAGLALGALLAWKPAQAQFNLVPSPVQAAAAKLSEADNDRSYRKDGARHIYASYPGHIHKGKLPPLMYAIAITETEIDQDGNVVNAVMVREPAAAKEVGPWVLAMIRKAGPFPKPTKMGRVKYTDVWLVDKTGKFQLDTLTEGQR
ncbi:MAG: hypothetical protein AB1430_12975 [Pseudomonadota bacterium]